MLLFYLNFVYLFLMVVSNSMIFFSGGLFFFWVSLELAGYGFLLVMYDNQACFSSFYKGIKIFSSYFVLQVLGSLFLFFSGFLNLSLKFFFLGLSMKLGFFPIFWWLPYYCKDLSNFPFFVYLTVSKFGVLYLFLFCPFSSSVWLILMVSAFLGLVGMGLTYKCMKTFMSWSSLVDNMFLVWVVSISLNFFFLSFLFYLLFYLLFFMYFSQGALGFNTSMGYLILMFFLMGVPFFFNFFYKFIFLKGFITGVSSGVFLTFCSSGLFLFYFTWVVIFQACYVLNFVVLKSLLLSVRHSYSLFFIVFMFILLPLFLVLYL